MAFNKVQSEEIIQILDAYITFNRPAKEIRHQVDIGYKIEEQSIILHEIRPRWDDASQTIHSPYAKTTFIQSGNYWKVFWIRASGKWDPYEPDQTVKSLVDFIKLVAEDKYHIFRG